MKFVFCGNTECPEWILAEIVILNKITAIKLRLICSLIVKKICHTEYDEQKLQKLCRDSDLSEEESQVTLALLVFILTNAGRYSIEDTIFNKELQQLGLPLENSTAIVRVYRENKDKLTESMKINYFRISKIKDTLYSVFAPVCDSIVDNGPVIRENEDEQAYTGLGVRLHMKLGNSWDTVDNINFIVDTDKIDLMFKELVDVQAKINDDL